MDSFRIDRHSKPNLDHILELQNVSFKRLNLFLNEDEIHSKLSFIKRFMEKHKIEFVEIENKKYSIRETKTLYLGGKKFIDFQC